MPLPYIKLEDVLSKIQEMELWSIDWDEIEQLILDYGGSEFGFGYELGSRGLPIETLEEELKRIMANE